MKAFRCFGRFALAMYADALHPLDHKRRNQSGVSKE